LRGLIGRIFLTKIAAGVGAPLAESTVGAGVLFWGEGFLGCIKEAIGRHFKSDAVFINEPFLRIFHLAFLRPVLFTKKSIIDQTYSSEISPNPSFSNPAKRGTPFCIGR
jgi:hypothetical protein